MRIDDPTTNTPHLMIRDFLSNHPKTFCRTIRDFQYGGARA